MSHFRRIRDDEDVGVDIDYSYTKEGKRRKEREEAERREREREEAEEKQASEEEERRRKKTYRSPTANYNIRESAPEDKGPLSMKDRETLPEGSARGEPGISPREPHHIPTRRERFVEGARTVGRGVKKFGHGAWEVYQYEPLSPENKRTIKKSFYGARNEVARAGRQYTGRRRVRTRSGYGGGRAGGDDFFGLGDIAGYSDMFSPTPPRSRSRRERGPNVEETLGYDPSDPFGLGGYGGGYGGYGGGRAGGGREDYGSDFSGYADQFDPFSNFGRRKSR